MTELKPFIALIRRATHSGYGQMVLNNRMFVQCYDLAIDAEVGFHYMLHIPDDVAYEDAFYDTRFIFSPQAVGKAYTAGHRELAERRKMLDRKSKDEREELKLMPGKLRMLFYLADDDHIITRDVPVQYPIDSTSSIVANIESTYETLAKRLVMGGACLVFDGIRYGLVKNVLECPEVYHFVVRYHGKKLRVPLIKSMFAGLKDPDRFLLSIQESKIPDVYVYSFTLTSKKLTEQYWGYILQY